MGCELPADAAAQSGSQDVFLHLRGGVVGFALKAASASSGTARTGAALGSLRDELSKAPSLLPADVPYQHTLVCVWNLHLAAQLKVAWLGSRESAVCGDCKWRLQAADNSLARLAGGGGSEEDEVCSFEVPAGTELVVANPHSPSGGGGLGAGRCWGAAVLAQLQGMSMEYGGMLILGDPDLQCRLAPTRSARYY